MQTLDKRITGVEESLEQILSHLNISPKPRVGLTALKSVTTQRPINDLDQKLLSYVSDNSTSGNFFQVVARACEFVEDHAAEYARALEIGLNSALKTKIVMEAVQKVPGFDLAEEAVLKLVQLFCELTKGTYQIQGSVTPVGIKQKGGTIRAVKKWIQKQ